MANEYDVSEIITTFLLNTCRLLPRLTKHDVQAAARCATIITKHPLNEEETEYIPLTTGSVAEFYIEPMLPHVGDVDVMYYFNSVLAIPRGHPPPTQLPAEFHNYVKVHEIIDSHLPGYVYLPLRYLLTRSTGESKYNYIKFDADKGRYYANRSSNSYGKLTHGPALLAVYSDSQLSVDSVRCARCLSWPQQAADWPTRHRNYGWPDSATLDQIVSNGCDLVGVAHRQCRQHKWIGKNQHRLSFSRAEIVLINSWMPVQQIAYHLLRYFIKTERLTDCADNSAAGTLSNYHIKTLMLWACEQKSRSWWTDDLDLVRICVELLHTLSVWLTNTRCPHYFISNCNLLDNSFNVGNVASKLRAIDEEYLSSWLVDNYIGQCAKLCPVHISGLFNDVSTTTKLLNVISKIVRWRVNASLDDMLCAIDFAEGRISAVLSFHSLTAPSCVCWLNKLTNIDKRLTFYFSAAALLYVACKILRNGFSDELMDILATVLGHNVDKSCSDLSLRETEMNTSELVELLQKSAVERLTTYRQLVARDFGSVVKMVTTDFEALYAYKRGNYQRCLQLSIRNVRTLLYAGRITEIQVKPIFTQLLDDDIVSLSALAMIICWTCRSRDHAGIYRITQPTLSLYLMTQCRLKLRHSVSSMARIPRYINVARNRHSRDSTLDYLTLKLTERKIEMLQSARVAEIYLARYLNTVGLL